MRTLITGLFLAVAGSAWAGPPRCGDGRAKGSEQCDGADLAGASCGALGLGEGALACRSDCTFDTSGCQPPVAQACGDGVVDPGEECDGAADAACPGHCSAHCACPAAPPGPLELHMVDVGQGDALVIVSPDGFVTLVDSGTEGNAPLIEAYLLGIGINGVDYTVVSHMHADHMGAMDRLLDAHPEVVAAFDHGGSAGSTAFDDYVAAAGPRRRTVNAGDTIDMGPAVIAEVLHASTGATQENDNSVVLRLTHGDVTMLLGGDCEGACEAAFDPGQIDLYKVHHHGSNTSSGAALLDRMAPYTALISVGNGNPFDHPDQEVLDRLAARDIDTWRTDLDGDLEVVSDGVGYTINGQTICALGETRACAGSSVGVCEPGQRACVGGFWGPCEGAIGPSAEACDNGLDDDCDGQTDGADADCAALAAGVVISQVGYDTPGTDSIEEFVDLFNPTGAAVSVAGWRMVDNAGVWVLPAGATIGANAFVSVARDAMGFEALYGLTPDFAGMTLSLGNSGDWITLEDAGGAAVDFVAWESAVAGWPTTARTGDAIERLDPTADTDGAADWIITSPAQPRGGSTPGGGGCGDGVCAPGEDCTTCASDCPGVTGGKPANRYCCGDGLCDPAEDAALCAVDCG